jgi:hypothetical protein
MARKFLYLIAGLIVLAAAGLFALRIWGSELAELAFVPKGAFVEQAPLGGTAYEDPAMWFSHPAKRLVDDPVRWLPEGAAEAEGDTPAFAVFFVHPTSDLANSRWNAPLDDRESQDRARLFLRGMASPFREASEIWAPRYRQATFGAFLTDAPEAGQAIDAAYRDVERAFDAFLAAVDPATPIVLAGHSQGALHVLRLLNQRVAGRDLRQRVAVAYPIGWPLSLEHDLPELGLPACAEPGQTGCIVSWSSFANPAEPGDWLEIYGNSRGFDGEVRGDSAILCTNPLTGRTGGVANAAANLGTLVPNASLTEGSLTAGLVPAGCDARGLLLIGEPPELGPYVLPGNNYHVYDIPLFWANLRADVRRRLANPPAR